MVRQVQVRGIAGELFTVDVCDTDEQMRKTTVKQLREKIAEKIPGHDLRMAFGNERLNDDLAPLSQYGIQHKSVIYVIVILPGGLAA
ncbi:ubiquitin-like protein NEDD8 [Trachinotus anak]|uniref:ubiquitin-like protein NEDD8 n=1 Tax=Trachinotus anak TaxID=443729 RepID=UPI0039F1B6E8